jgi:hypothetical protein
MRGYNENAGRRNVSAAPNVATLGFALPSVEYGHRELETAKRPSLA